jgi:hypothetical protein
MAEKSTPVSQDPWSQAVEVVWKDAQEVVEAFLARHQGGELHPHIVLSTLTTVINHEFVKHYPKPERAR